MASALVILVLVHLLASLVSFALYRIITAVLPDLAPRSRHDLAFTALIAASLAPVLNVFTGGLINLPAGDPQLDSGALGVAAMALVAAWFIGAVYLSARLALALVAARGLVARSRKMDRPDAAIWLARALGLKLSDEIETPQLAGLPDPVVLVPCGMEEQLGDDAVRGLIEHEYAHLERGDLWFALVQRLIVCVFWWNPLMQKVAGEIDLQREMACDDMAVSRFGNAHGYASSILDLADRVAVRHTGMAAAAIGSPSDLVTRMRRLMDQPQVLHHPVLSLALLVLVLFSGGAVAALMPRAEFVSPSQLTAQERRYSEELVEAVGTQSDAIIRMLLADGADPNSQRPDGQTPLSRAMQTSQTSTIRILLQAGADPNTVMVGGDRPIHAALRSQIVDNVELLLDHGAATDIASANGTTTRELAMSSRNQDLIELIMSQPRRD